jgi:hypothetical protein
VLVADIQPSVVYRVGPLSAADYDEAVEALREARTQLEPDGRGCVVCGDTGHQAMECHHNPLVLARRHATAEDVWKCFHCGDKFTTEADARRHFGPELSPAPVCATALTRVAAAARALAEEAVEDVARGVAEVDAQALGALNHALDELDDAVGAEVRA